MDVIVCSNRTGIADVVGRLFEREGSRHTVCESGLEVLGLIGVMHCDLLVVDLETPGLGGLLMISAIRELAPALPILALSTSDGVDARALLEKGVPFVRLELDHGMVSDGAALRAELTRFGKGSESLAKQTG